METSLAVAALAFLGLVGAWMRRKRARARVELSTDTASFYASIRARQRSKSDPPENEP